MLKGVVVELKRGEGRLAGFGGSGSAAARHPSVDHPCGRVAADTLERIRTPIPPPSAMERDEPEDVGITDAAEFNRRIYELVRTVPYGKVSPSLARAPAC